MYDITVAFQSPKNPDFSHMIFGHECRAEAFIRRIPIEEVPVQDEQKAADFVHQLFQEKVRRAVTLIVMI